MTPARATRNRIATLVAAALFTGVAILANFDHDWDIVAPVLRTVAVGAWVILAVGVAADRIITLLTNLRADVTQLREDVTQLRADIDTYGDGRQIDAWIDLARTNGHTPPATAPPNLKRIR